MEHIWLHGILRIPIHTLLRATQLTQQHNVVPFFIVKLLLETNSQGLYYRDNNGMIPLHHAVDCPSRLLSCSLLQWQCRGHDNARPIWTYSLALDHF